MPAVRPAEIVKAIIEAVGEGGASAILISNASGNPRQFIVQYERRTFELWAYIWTLTHGGGKARPRDEYRIQITSVQPSIQANPNGPTLLLGYEPNTQCFAGFDLRKHRTFSTRSPSIQIPITALHEALQHGLSFTTKSNDEIAIGIRSDQLLSYALNATIMHREGADAEMIELLTKAAALEQISVEDEEAVTPERKRILREVSHLSRDSSFRRKVIHAYDRRCAVTRIQLRLIDAAHILPVGAEGSSDRTTNGICLSPTYHRAFDQALIYLDGALNMQINPAKEQELVTVGLAGGLESFKSYLGARIHLPEDKGQWPDMGIVRSANKYRGVQT